MRLSAIAFFPVAFFASLLVVAGCGSSTPPVDGPVAAPTAEAAPEAEAPRVPPPDIDKRSSLGIIHGNGKVRVGELASEALAVFGEAPRAFPFSDLPSRFKRPYAAKGWETATEGFGVITYDDVVYAALHQIDRGDQDRLDAILKIHESAFVALPNEFISSRTARYWFWSENGHLLMICAYQPDPKTFRITTAMGDERVLEGMGISVAKARADAQALDEEATAKATAP